MTAGGATRLRGARSILHGAFEAGILLKALNAAGELVGAFLLLAMKPESMHRLVRILTQGELAEDPSDLLAGLLAKAGASYSTGLRDFGIFYLSSHGLVKLALVYLLWRKRLWAYPAAVIALIGFIAYQVYTWQGNHSAFLAALSILDCAMIALTLVEYRRLKASAALSA